MERYLIETAMLDYSNAAIQQMINEHGWYEIDDFEKIKQIYTYVRDNIKFGYNVDDNIPASRVLSDGYGQCNTHLKVITNGKSVPILAKGQNPFVGGCSSMFALIFCNVMKLFGKGNHLFPAIDESYSNRMIVVSDENKKEIGKIIGGRIIMTAGHTADSMSLKVGDCIFCGDASMNGLPSINKITIWVEDIKAFENSWDVMINEKPICIYPGHGKPFKTCMLERKKHCISKIKLHELKN